MGDFVHLHLHTEYSMLDGMAKISKVVKKAKEMGMPALAITDHGNMYGAVAFFNACHDKDVNIKPIIGTEFYVSDDLTVHQKNQKIDANDEGYRDRRHLILLCKNSVGYDNIAKLNAIAFRDGFYYKPRIDLKTLEKYHEGLICLSACIGGDIPQAILHGDYEKAESLVVFFKNLFGDDFYLEMQNHGMREELVVNSYLRQYSKKYGVKTVVTNDVHYINKEDAETQDILLCVQTASNYDDENRMRMPNNEFYLKSYDEMLSLFPEDKDAVDRTMEIVDKCNFNFVFGEYMFPKYTPENGDDPKVYINKLIDDGIKKKMGGVRTPEIDERLKTELGIIEKQGFIEYFLIVWDYINAARSMGISVGPGRGSGAGSLVAYLIGITDIDPLKYNLYFERFLNSERVSAPDFDVDFEDSRRQEVVEYVKRKYGDNRVCKIITFGTMAAKNAIKDVGRVLKVGYADLDRLTKNLPTKVTKGNRTYDIKRPFLDKILGYAKPNKNEIQDGLTDFDGPETKEYREIYNTNPELKRVLDIARKLEDTPRQSGIHACGVIIGHDILDRHMPLSRNGDIITSQYVGAELESLGFLKMDFLGLRNLTDIKLTIQYVKENYGIDVVFDKKYDDPKVYDLISSGNTTAIFQIESGGFKNFLMRLKPNCLEDIVAAVSLYRPGPMDSIDDFIKNKFHPDEIVYDHPKLKPILEQTYGCIVYQEQVMKIVQDLAGYTLGQADNVRRMMGKKKVDAMATEFEYFVNGRGPMEDHGRVSPAIEGCLKRGVSKEVAVKVWDKMKDFAKYAFNKSHAAAYSIVTYETAYLKCYYEAEFITAILSNRITNIKDIINYIQHAKEEGIPVLPPDINESKTYFSVKDKKIRFGLAAVKGVGVSVIDQIVEERENNGKFESFESFVLRCYQFLNKRLLANLVKAGAFDSFGRPRSHFLMVHEQAIDQAVSMKKGNQDLECSIFDLLDIKETLTLSYPDIEEFSNLEKLKFEKEVCGMYITGNPLADYEREIRDSSFNTSMVVYGEEDTENSGKISYIENDLKEGSKVSFIGMITSTKRMITKKGDEMNIIALEDLYGSIEVPVFPKVYIKVKNILEEDAIVKVVGRLSIRDDQDVSIMAETIEKLDEKVVKKATVSRSLNLGIRVSEEYLEDVLEIIGAYPGNIPVIIEVNKVAKRANVCVRKCDALIDELLSIVDENNVKFFER